MTETETSEPQEELTAAEAEQVTPKPTSRQRAPHLTNEEMTAAMLAHASTLLGFATGGLAGVAAAFLIWLLYREKSKYVAFQAMQALVFQMAWMGATIAVAAAMVLSILTICLIPLGLVLLLAVVGLPFAGLFYGLYAAYETYYGADFLYWKVGEFVQQQMAISAQ
jgi:uncharacterized Tic20 family protein